MRHVATVSNHIQNKSWKQTYTHNFVEVSVSFSGATGILQSRSATPNGHDLSSLNKLMREAKSMQVLCRWIAPVPSSCVWLTAADAASANRPDGSSTSGHVIMAAHPNTASVLAWNSRKMRRVVRSSLGAESVAFLEHTDMFRVLYGELCGDLFDLAEYEKQSPSDRSFMRG